MKQSIIVNGVKRLSPSITDMIRMDHARMLKTFHRYRFGSSPQSRKALVDSVCLALEIHAQIEEEIFYPALRHFAADAPAISKSLPEHAEMRRIIVQLRLMDASNPGYDSAFMQLMREIMHHVADEETVLLPDAERLMPERLVELGAQMAKRRMQLAPPHAGELAVNTVRTRPATSMLVAAGAVLAGTYLARRAIAARRH